MCWNKGQFLPLDFNWILGYHNYNENTGKGRVIMDGIFCNKCGKSLKVENKIVREDFISICKPWGYFSKKDGKTQEFIICEECIDKFTEEFVITVKEYDTAELI